MVIWHSYALCVITVFSVGDVCDLLSAEPDSNPTQQLIKAAQQGAYAQIQSLVEQRANINGHINGMTPLMHAAMRGHVVTVKTLIYYGAREDNQDTCGWTAFDHARFVIENLKGNKGHAETYMRMQAKEVVRFLSSDLEKFCRRGVVVIPAYYGAPSSPLSKPTEGKRKVLTKISSRPKESSRARGHGEMSGVLKNAKYALSMSPWQEQSVLSPLSQSSLSSSIPSHYISPSTQSPSSLSSSHTPGSLVSPPTQFVSSSAWSSSASSSSRSTSLLGSLAAPSGASQLQGEGQQQDEPIPLRLSRSKRIESLDAALDEVG